VTKLGKQSFTGNRPKPVIAAENARPHTMKTTKDSFDSLG